MSPWFWYWKGPHDDGYGGEHRTKEEAIAEARREVGSGQSFEIIEARMSEAAKYEGEDFIPFLRSRNHEVIQPPAPVVTKPYRMQRLGILNHEGGLWTPETFDSVEAGQAYIDRARRQNPTWDLSNHRVVPVRVTVSVVKPPKADREQPGTQSQSDGVNQ